VRVAFGQSFYKFFCKFGCLEVSDTSIRCSNRFGCRGSNSPENTSPAVNYWEASPDIVKKVPARQISG
jgi:hypothetical protein